VMVDPLKKGKLMTRNNNEMGKDMTNRLVSEGVAAAAVELTSSVQVYIMEC